MGSVRSFVTNGFMILMAEKKQPDRNDAGRLKFEQHVQALRTRPEENPLGLQSRHLHAVFPCFFSFK